MLALAILVSGCVSSPKNQSEKLKLDTPGRWASAKGVEATFDPNAWASDFKDSGMEAIVAEALEHNYDLKAASARLDAALASSVANRSGFWPSVSLSGNGSKSKRNSASGIQQTPTSETFGLNGRFNWEIDLWGKLRNGYKGALADDEAAIADYRAARLSIGARAAKAWYSAIEASQQFALESRIIEALEESSRIVEENFSNGIAGALDVRLVRANLASSRSSLEVRRRTRNAAIRSLELLLGRYPASELSVATDLPKLGGEMPAGLPSELLLRRPDVVAAERRLAAAEQRQFEAGKARIPSLNLNLSRGTNSSEIGDIFEVVEKRIWSQSLGVTQTLFSGGRLKANHKRAKANYELILANYTQTVLRAFEEVETALSEQDAYMTEYGHLQMAAEESVEAEGLAWDEYSSGLTDITTVLDSIRRSINSQRSYIRVANQLIQNRIDLYLALGGGFETDDTLASR